MKKSIFGLFIMIFSISILNASVASEVLLNSANGLKDIVRSEGLYKSGVLKKAKAIVIIPSAKRVGFFLGGEFGEGVATVKRYDGTWSNPFFVQLKGGSFGWQFGFDSNTILLVFNTKKSVESLLKNKITLGVDLSISAGYLSKNYEKKSEVDFSAEVYAYRKSEGAFIGVSLKGSVLTQDLDKDVELYGNKMGAKEIINMNNRLNIYAMDEFFKALEYIGR